MRYLINVLNTQNLILIHLGSCRNKNAINDHNDRKKDKEREEEEEKGKKITTIQKNFQKIIALRNLKKK